MKITLASLEGVLEEIVKYYELSTGFYDIAHFVPELNA